MFALHFPRRAAPARRAPCRNRRWQVEPLEGRLAPAINVVPLPNWAEQGPGPLLGAQLLAPPDSPASGGVSSIAIDPNDARNIYVGTVNGGVWRSTNADPANPAAVTWAPLTDQVGSLSIASVAISPLDPTGHTVYAGVGQFSNHFDGGNPLGLLRTDDGGATWDVLGAGLFADQRLKAVVPTRIDLDPGPGVSQVVLVGTVSGAGRDEDGPRNYAERGGALYRSPDGGATFEVISGSRGLPGGAVPSLVADPNDALRFFAAVAGAGVFRSDNGGLDWVAADVGVADVVGSSVIELAVVADPARPGGTALYAAVATNDTLNGVYRSIDAGATWAPLGAPGLFNAGSFYHDKVSLAADPAAAGVVYVSGQGAQNVYRYDPAGNRWLSIVEAGARFGTAPHADSRDLVFLDDNTLLEADDGGLYLLRNPTNAAANAWQGFTGNLRAMEHLSVALDPVNRVVFAGAQDNGTQWQRSPGGSEWDWQFGGDGFVQQVDSTSAGPGVFRYSVQNNFQFFYRSRFSADNRLLNRDLRRVSGASNGPAIVITSPGHGLATGDGVNIFRVKGNLAANGAFRVTVLNADQFQLDAAGSGAYLGGGVWERTRVIGAVGGARGAPVRIASSRHGLATGDQVLVQGLTGNAGLNRGSYYVTVLNANLFTLDGTSADGGASTGGFWAVSSSVTLKSSPGGQNLSGLNDSDRGNNSFTFNQYVLNAVDPRRMLLGFYGVYEDADPSAANGLAGDVIAEITPALPGFRGEASALAYGGWRGGAGRADVALVGTTSGQLYFRGESGRAFTPVAVGGSGELRDIALDPQDWRRVYVVRGGEVWRTDDITAPGGGFVNVTDNLGGLTQSQVRTIDLVDLTPGVAGDSVPVVGGLGGVFRRLPAGPGGAAWSEFGMRLPNALVKDVRFYPVDFDGRPANGTGMLVAGTLGRGAWTVSNVSAFISSLAPLEGLEVTGGGDADTIELRPDPANPDHFLVSDGAGPAVSFPRSRFHQVDLKGGGGDDVVRLLAGGDLTWLSFLVNADGGGQAGDRLVIEDGPDPVGRVVTVTTNTVGAAPDDTLFSPLGAVTYANFAALVLGLGAGEDRLRAGNVGDNLWVLHAVNAGVVSGGLSVAFTGAEHLVGGRGDDTFVVRVGGRVTGRLDGGGSADGDALVGQGSAGHDVMSLTPGRLLLNGAPTVFDDIEAVRLLGEGGHDRFELRFAQGSPVPANGVGVIGGPGSDLLTTVGTALADRMSLAPGFLKVNAAAPIAYAQLERMDLYAGGGNDVFDARSVHYQAALAGVRFFGEGGDDSITLAPSATTGFFVHGGLPGRPALPGDALYLVRAGQLGRPPAVLSNGGSDGLYRYRNRKAVQFASIERGVGGYPDIQP